LWGKSISTSIAITFSDTKPKNHKPGLLSTFKRDTRMYDVVTIAYTQSLKYLCFTAVNSRPFWLSPLSPPSVQLG
jgi:hypothetical protein